MSRRVLIAGVSVLAVLAVLFIAGYFFLLSDRNGDGPNNASPSTSPTDPRSEIEQAYLRFWDVWADANLRLDASRLEEAATGTALEALRATVEEQRAKNEPVRVRVEHNYTIAILGTDSASVDDKYINHSVRLDPQTDEPTEPDPNQPVRKTWSLKKVDGKWKIAEIIEYR